ILLSTHILSEVETICERVIIIANGRVGLSQRLDEIESESKIIVEARGPGDQMEQSLWKLNEVTSVKAKGGEDGVAGFEVRTTENRDIREEMSKMLSSKG